MLPRGILLDKEGYREIVNPSIRWGFELTFDEQYVGRPSIRRSLEEAAHNVRGDAYEVLREEFVKFLSGVDLTTRENWYLQGIRGVLQTLLANPSCTTGAGELAAALKKVNQIQRSRPQTISRAVTAV